MMTELGFSKNDMNLKTAMLTKTVKNAVESGDTKALNWLMDLYEKSETSNPVINNPDNLYNLYNMYSGIPAHLICSTYVDIYRDIRDRRHRFYDFKGGRGSLKSSFCALILVDEIMRNSNLCAIALRQVKDTLKNSVYAQIAGAIEMLGLSDYFTCTISNLQIKKKDTGQIIYFRGCDDPVKIKSIKPPKGVINGKPCNMHIGVVWFEEKDQFKGNETIRNIQQSVMRGGDDIIVLSSYNTPISRRHFLNIQAAENSSSSNRIIHHSCYTDVPKEWLGQPFLDEAEYLKNTNEKAYRHEYLGEAIGESGNVFENVTVRPFYLEDSSTFERFYYGVDWGFYPDPWTFVKCCYSPKDRMLYIIDEARAYKKSNQETAEILINEKGIAIKSGKDFGDMIICDSSEPKSIADYVNCGLYARGAEKGAISSKYSRSSSSSKSLGGSRSSIVYSMRWLQGLKEIIIDSDKCPHTAKEFSEYEYERGSDNEVLSGYPDRNNHFIDAVRYATNMLWRRGLIKEE